MRPALREVNFEAAPLKQDTIAEKKSIVSERVEETKVPESVSRCEEMPEVQGKYFSCSCTVIGFESSEEN